MCGGGGGDGAGGGCFFSMNHKGHQWFWIYMYP